MATRHTAPRLATFAGGCFWCMVGPFESLPGVLSVTSGYAGGSKDDATYERVCSGRTQHVEAVQVAYDPARVTYEQLLGAFWRGIDPTDDGGQFADRGSQYRSAIFYGDEHERILAEKSKAELAASGRFGKPIVVRIVPFTTFFAAEGYHQQYHSKNPVRYKMYRLGSGRDTFLKEAWK